MKEMLYPEESYAIVGAAYKVHRELGSGFLESVYQEAFELMLQELKIPYEREKELKIMFRGKQLEKTFKADFVCYGKIIVELKAVREIVGEHEAQVINYLKATGMKLGLLLNFGAEEVQSRRLVRLYCDGINKTPKSNQNSTESFG